MGEATRRKLGEHYVKMKPEIRAKYPNYRQHAKEFGLLEKKMIAEKGPEPKPKPKRKRKRKR